MHRRTFLQSVAGLVLWPTGTNPKPIITALDDGGYLIEVGCLRCYSQSGGSVLDIVPWVIDHPMPGMELIRRMVPTAALKEKLEQVGFPTRPEGYEQHPSLVARLSYFLAPNEVAAKLQQILRCGDWTLLYYDPESGGKGWL